MALDLNPLPPAPADFDRLDVAADGLGRYTIDVSLPAGYAKGDARYPVILVTDGNILFDIVRVLVHGDFAKVSPAFPPSIVVGVGYPADEGMASWYARRNFDFHGPWDMESPLGKYLYEVFGALKASEGKPDLEIRAGGYERFMAFLRDDLLPALGAQYRIDPDARHTLIGDSSGGHFTLRALYDAASPFRRYVAISPSTGTADGAIQRAEAEYAATHDDLDVDLFMCFGKQEVDQSPPMALCRFGSGVTWIAEQFGIRQWPNARVHWEVMDNEDHASIAPRGIAAGLRSVHRVRPGVHEAEVRKAAAERLEALKGSQSA